MVGKGEEVGGGGGGRRVGRGWGVAAGIGPGGGSGTVVDEVCPAGFGMHLFPAWGERVVGGGSVFAVVHDCVWDNVVFDV